MDHFPLFARIAHQPCLVVGGGVVALRKARELLRAGARVTVNAPELHPGIRELARAGALRVEQRPFTASLVAESLLVIDPVNETAYRILMLTAAALGNRAGIARAMTQCRTMLRDIVDTTPSLETQQLFQKLTRETG